MDSDPLVDFGIILTAGGSTRMGEPKALLKWRDQFLVNAHIQALQPICSHIIVVTGAHTEEISAVLSDSVELIHNPHWAETHMSDSLRLGLAHCHGTALVTPIDCEPAPLHCIHSLCREGAPAVPHYRGQDGHPVLVRVRDVRNSTESLQALLQNARRVKLEWAGTTHNWNTPSDWKTYSSSAGSTRS